MQNSERPTDAESAIQEEELPSRAMLRAQLAEGQALIAECARIARDPCQTASAQIYATSAAAKLMAAASQAAAAISRLYDSETRRYVAEAQVNGFIPTLSSHRATPRSHQDLGADDPMRDYEYFLRAQKTENPENKSDREAGGS